MEIFLTQSLYSIAKMPHRRPCRLENVKIWGAQVAVTLAATLGGSGQDQQQAGATEVYADAVVEDPQGANDLISRAKSLTASLLAQGYLLGKMGFQSLQEFNSRNKITRRLSETAKQLDEKLKVSATAASINDQFKVTDFAGNSLKETHSVAKSAAATVGSTAAGLHASAMKSQTYKSGFGMLRKFGAKK